MTGPDQLAGVVRAALVEAGLPDRRPSFERPRQREHGDWSTNVALQLAKPVGRPPRAIAELIVEHLDLPAGVAAAEVAGPGFLNFRMAQSTFADTIRQVVGAGAAWGRTSQHSGRRANVEFVSANPTGPLHIGAGRWAAVGDAVASLLEATGWDVVREYYFNDAGRQMRLFGDSVAAAIDGSEPPEDGYRGTYIGELAEDIQESGETGDVSAAAYRRMLERITATLHRFRVDFDVFFGERTLHDSQLVPQTIDRLRAHGHVYEAEGAVWLRTTDFGDDKDRVLVRSDGTPTYFAADCAYLVSKLDRGFDKALVILGADHHGYKRRMHAIELALGGDGSHMEVVIGQMVNFLRGGKPVRMSKRTGEMVTFDDLMDEVGPDAARYTFLRTSMDVTINFDLAEVVRQERDNPVYYVQYSSARIAGIMRTARERGVHPGTVDQAALDLLTHETEQELVRRISTYPEAVAYAAEDRAPHRVARYAEELAEAFHKFYTECTVVGDDPELTRARYWLVEATRQTLVNALGLLGVTAPERM